MVLESYSSSSMKLLLFMVPLIIVAGLVSVLGPNPSNWTSIPNPSGDDVTTKTMEKAQVVVAAAVDFHNKEVKAISDDSLFNLSSTPPLSIQAIPQILVRE
ncbi:transmembrane protein, putative [Medicago truncatula]|uniref:Transmembrane protein, putative n=1 Tax=Medicago truncatula TaxID=3880 RepID=A0A072UE27_MEDTR|nr:transmembrane protein, putative [Medicago truncatula]